MVLISGRPHGAVDVRAIPFSASTLDRSILPNAPRWWPSSRLLGRTTPSAQIGFQAAPVWGDDTAVKAFTGGSSSNGNISMGFLPTNHAVPLRIIAKRIIHHPEANRMNASR